MAYRFIDLFAGMGGIRKGLELASQDLGIDTECVFTSEIKPSAIRVLQENHPNEKVYGDITKIPTENIPEFDILLGGFPCQAFSAAGQKKGFADTRGTMFFEIARILKDKQPKGFILENVSGLLSHDKGNTFATVMDILEELGYIVIPKLLNSKDFGVAQDRLRIYISGIRKDLCDAKSIQSTFEPVPNTSIMPTIGNCLDYGQPTSNSKFVKKLLSKFTLNELYGKSIKDKRGGDNNIHSWDIGLKGDLIPEERYLLGMLMTERRKKKWASIIGIEWMDGMPLTYEQIKTFVPFDKLPDMLTRLTNMGYLSYEHPKQLVEVIENGQVVKKRVPDTTKEKGYNIVAGKLSFEVGEILDPNGITPTLVATDMCKLFVGDNGGLRQLTPREGLRLFGYPEDFKMSEKGKDAFDLLGNTVVVPVIKAVATQLLKHIH